MRHISQSRRLRPGDDFLLQDRLGQRFRVKLLNQRRQRLEFEVLEAAVVPEPSPLSLELWLALLKEKALELILQKGVELGVSRVVLFQGNFERSCRSSCDKCSAALGTHHERSLQAVRSSVFNNLDMVSILKRHWVRQTQQISIGSLLLCQILQIGRSPEKKW